MSEKKLVLIPMLEDLLAAGAAAGVASFRGKSAGRSAMEQLVSSLVAKNIANYTTMTDNLTSNAFQVPIDESDVLTGVVRAGYGMYMKRSNQEVVMDGLGGVLAQLLGRELKKTFFGTTTA